MPLSRPLLPTDRGDPMELQSSERTAEERGVLACFTSDTSAGFSGEAMLEEVDVLHCCWEVEEEEEEVTSTTTFGGASPSCCCC